MPEFEEHLNALETRITTALKATEAALASLRSLRAKAKVGSVNDIEKSLPVVRRRAEEAAAAVSELANEWDFDVGRYLSDGRYLEELLVAAKAGGLSLFAKDGRIYSFPLLSRIEPKELAVRIGKKLERRIRPGVLVRLLAESQKRPQRFREAQFLEVLYKIYQRLGGSDWRKAERERGPVIRVTEIHDTLTLLPGSDYSIEEFARDLLLLDRQPDLRTRDGCRFELPKSTGSKETGRRVAVYDEEGHQHLYVGVRFVKEA